MFLWWLPVPTGHIFLCPVSQCGQFLRWGQVGSAPKPFVWEICSLYKRGRKRPFYLYVSQSYFHSVHSTCLCCGLLQLSGHQMPLTEKGRLLLLLFTWLMLVTLVGHLKKETLGWYSGLKCSPRIQVYSEPQNVIKQ